MTAHLTCKWQRQSSVFLIHTTTTDCWFESVWFSVDMILLFLVCNFKEVVSRPASCCSLKWTIANVQLHVDLQRERLISTTMQSLIQQCVLGQVILKCSYLLYIYYTVYSTRSHLTQIFFFLFLNISKTFSVPIKCVLYVQYLFNLPINNSSGTN